MIGLYLLTTSQLAKDETIKFGMSMRIEYRWIDYLAIFSDSKYVYYYEFLDELTREEILIIEDVQSWDWIDILSNEVPLDLKQYIQSYDLRENKNRYDDIVFTINKSNL